ncbi:MAG: aminoacyl-tRNA hydrolase [Deltaproteobacteria bacterium]
MYIIVGLGNPGKVYENTRHNVGFKAVDLLEDRLNINVSKKKFNALIGEGSFAGEKVTLIKPQTYMNLSGETIIQALNWYKISLSNLLIIYDDVDLDVGNIRIRERGSAGTHNGMRSIVNCVGTEDFPRIRVGIGKPPNADYDLADYVLSKFSQGEDKDIKTAIENTADASLAIIQKGITFAMNKYN